MIIVSTPNVPGREIYQVVGLVRGNTVRAKNVFRDIGALLKSIIGGELRDYSQMMTEAREEALRRMAADAERLGANAVVNTRFTTSAIMGGASEILAYGTAVKLR
jgi:uncharacterized protein YbjQ (UPF0145 family)